LERADPARLTSAKSHGQNALIASLGNHLFPLLQQMGEEGVFNGIKRGPALPGLLGS
jgi:hypothetical protein